MPTITRGPEAIDPARAKALDQSGARRSQATAARNAPEPAPARKRYEMINHPHALSGMVNSFCRKFWDVC